MTDISPRAPEPGAPSEHHDAHEKRAGGGCLPLIIGFVVLAGGLTVYLVFFNHFG